MRLPLKRESFECPNCGGPVRTLLMDVGERVWLPHECAGASS